MTKPELYLAGRRLDLVKRIGKGAEGEVYLLDSEPKRAVKFYTDKEDKGREEKIKAMIGLGLAEAHAHVAFPKEIVTLKSGMFAGFTMRLIEGCQQVHELYGLKSRKTYFPKADFRFLLYAASNTARAMAEVHHSNCVISDVNQRGILVSNDARVALIDADSFQLDASGRTYPCFVGTPDFTPPELQRKTLDGVTRTRAHDHFALAVVIFQLLFMGRHPYAGLYSGANLTLDEFIARNLFAYSRTRSTGVSPPSGVATLEDFPSSIERAFERAFGLNPAQRPAALEWAGLLRDLGSQLSHCSTDSMHFYPNSAKGCPWCRMEARSGAILFLPHFTGIAPPGVVDFDVAMAWAAIKAVVIEDILGFKPKLPALPTEPSPEAKKAKRSAYGSKVTAAAMAAAAIALWAIYPTGALLWIGTLAYALFLFNLNNVDSSIWHRRYREIDTRWDEAQEKWRERLGINALGALRAELERAVEEYRGLSGAKANVLARLKAERRDRQLHEFLDRFLIQRASIAGIGPARTMTLASFGIESAADINRSAIMGIPGFGPSIADKLLAWRANHERRFAYNPAPLPSDAQAQATVEREFAAKAATLAKRIAGGQAELTQNATRIRQRLSFDDGYMHEVGERRAQLETDLKFLAISIPFKTTTGRYSQNPVSTLTSPPVAAPSAVTCPRCGAPMVRRTAKHGYRSRNMFWGCSRYPACRGTRN
jgi:DNA-binding helix-hairpin-helix protein with protein kinase domain